MELRGCQQNRGRSSSRATGGMLNQQTEATDPADTNEPLQRKNQQMKTLTKPILSSVILLTACAAQAQVVRGSV